MRVAIIAPNYLSGKTGNAVTVKRIEGHLRALGCEVQVFAVNGASEGMLEKVKAFSPELIHAFHGYLGGRMAHAISEILSLPYLVTLTGTDVYQALCDQRSHDTHLALRGAARVVAFHPSIKRRLAEHLPTLEERTMVIAQGVELPPAEPAAPATAGDEIIFLLPAGLRPVKNVLFPLEPLASLHAAHPELRFHLVGPVLDSEYAAEVLDALEPHEFARYLGEVAHEAMADLYRRATVVLNSSEFEGGMANGVLEALSHGKAVLASGIEGNRSIIKEGVTGFLYHDAKEFLSKAEHLISDPQLRERLGKNGRALVQEKHDPRHEAEAYLELYREVVKG